MLELRNVTGGWNQTIVNEDVTLTLDRGETVALVGRNGVGKSTLFEVITGRARLRAGGILLEGRDVTGLDTFERARLGLGYVPQNREVFRSLTVAEHLSVAARPGQWNAEAIWDLFPSLAERRQALAAHLSGGEQQMLAIARALVGNPRVILMDEPSEGLAPIIVEMLVDVLRRLVAGGDLAILLIEQRIDIALDLATRCLVMDRGRIIHQGTSAEIRDAGDSLADLIGLSEAD